MVSVLVVGAGPTGLVLACDLARRGVPLRIVDKAPGFPTGSRAKGLQPRSLEVFDDLGIADQTVASGWTDFPFRYYQRDRVIRDVDPSAENVPTPDVPYGPLLIPQWRVEEVLRARLAELGAAVEVGTELVGFSEDGETVRATLGRADGGSERVETSYLVGCDGGHSTVRKALGVGFDGETYGAELGVLGDVEVDGLSPDRWHMWSDDKGALLLCPLPGTRSWQFQASPWYDEQGRMPEPSLDVMRRIFAERAGLPGVSLHNPTWLSTYRVNVRMVDRLRVGRAFLAGDAAHVHSIAGGLGMNTGIQDAYNLGWKLALVLSGMAGPGLLDTYEEERLPIAAWTLRTSSERQRAVFDAMRAGRGAVDAAGTPETRQLGLGYRGATLARDTTGRAGRVRAGDRAPDAPCQDAATGVARRLFDVFRGPHFTLLGFGGRCDVALHAGYPEGVATCLVTAPSEDCTEGLIDAEGHAFRAYDIEGDTLVLVRPDGYIGLTAPSHDVHAVLDYLGGR